MDEYTEDCHCIRWEMKMYILSLFLSLSLSHTHTHARTHARTHALTHSLAHSRTYAYVSTTAATIITNVVSLRFVTEIISLISQSLGGGGQGSSVAPVGRGPAGIYGGIAVRW